MPARESFSELIERGLVALRGGDFAAAEAIFGRAGAAAEDESERALARIHEASVAVLQERTSPAAQALPDLLLRCDSAQHVFLAAYYLIMHLAQRGEAGRASWYVPRVLAAAEELNDAVSLAAAHESAAAVAIARREFDAAREHSLRALSAIGEESDATRVVLLRAASLHNVGYALLGLGRRGEATEVLRRSVALLEPAGLEAYTTEPYLNLSFAACLEGDTDSAAAYLEVLEARKEHLNARLLKYLYYLRGEIQSRRGDHAAARESFEQLRAFYPGFTSVGDLLAAISLLPVLLPE